MLDGLAAKAHFRRVSIEPRLHGLKDGFVLTALNLLPSIATLASLNSPRRRHSTTNSRQTLRMASPLLCVPKTLSVF